jgi:hypothetical protein
MVGVVVAQEADQPQQAGGGQEAKKETKGPTKKPVTHDQAVAFLKKVDAAAKAVKSVKYKGSFTRIQGDQRSEIVEGAAYMAGEFTGGYTVFKFDVTVRRGGSEEVLKFTAGGDGEEFYLVDHQTKMVYADLDPAVIGFDGRTAQSIGMIEFIHATPFSDEIHATSCEMKETATVGGEACQVIRVVYAGGIGQVADWYFSKKDFLPRRVDRHMEFGGRKMSTEQIVTDLVVDPKVERKELAPFVPEGFTKTDDFAPGRTRAR